MSDATRLMVPQGPWPVASPPGLPPLRAGMAEPGAKLRELLQAFKRRARLVIVALVVLNVAAFVAVQSVKPRYTADATILIGPRQQQVLDLKSVLAGLGGDSEAIESEVQVLRSRKIARAVVQQLQLDSNPEFVTPIKGPGLVADATGFLRARWNILAARYRPGWEWPEAEAETPGRVRDPAALAADAFMRKLGVTPRGRSRVVSVTFESGDPALAAAAANAVAETYIADQLRAKREATSSAHRWLEDRVAEMREQVINADQRVAAYRRRAAITQGRTGTLLSEQISALGEQTIQARVARSNAEARLRALQAGGGRSDALPEVLSSPIIQSLRAQESTLQAQVAELSRTYGDSHPRVASARAAAGAISGRIGAEASRVAGNLQDELRTAQAREASLNASLAALRQQVDSGTENEVELRALQHEAEANRALYDRLLARSRETNVEGGLQQPDAQVLAKADVPEAPSFPNPAIILPIFFIASCIATILLVFAVEAMDSGFATLEQVELAAGVAAIGLMPRIRGDARRAIAAGRPNLMDGKSAYGEAVRSLYTSLMLSSAERPKVVLVTSALPGEGRSTVVLSLARLMASCGKRVVVVDCDLRRPDLHRACGVAIGPGLAECLAGETPVYDVLQCDRASPAYVVAAGSDRGTSPDLFASDAMRQLVRSLSDRFDLVLLDSSPMLAVSDTRNLCRLADTTLMAVRWRETRRFAVLAGVRQILQTGGHFAGILLCNVDLKHYARHSTAGAYQRRIGLYLSE